MKTILIVATLLFFFLLPQQISAENLESQQSQSSLETPVPDDNGHQKDAVGILSGIVRICNSDGEPVEGVQVIAEGYGQIATTNQWGFFEALVPDRNYNLIFQHEIYPAFEQSDITVYNPAQQSELAAKEYFIITPEVLPQPYVIEMSYIWEYDDIVTEHFSVENIGCAQMEYEISVEILGDYTEENPAHSNLDDVWDLIYSFIDIGNDTQASDNSSIAMGSEEFYVTSSIDGTISTFDYDGTLITQIPIEETMQGDSLLGLVSITNGDDGYLYGGNDTGALFKFLPDMTEVVNVGIVTIDPNTIAYDWENNYLYVSDGSGVFYQMQPNGTPVGLAFASVEITGMAYCQLDPDGYTIYAHTNTNPTSIIKYNPFTNTWDETPISIIYDENIGYGDDIACGLRIGDSYDFMTIRHSEAFDIVDLWEGFTAVKWLRIEQPSGILEAGESNMHEIIIDPASDPEFEIPILSSTDIIIWIEGPNFDQTGVFLTIEWGCTLNDSKVINDLRLFQNSPNPFNPSTTIQFDLKKTQDVTLTVFNLIGQEVERLVDGNLNAGQHSINFDGSHLASGIYFYRIETPEFTDMKKMVIMK